MFNLPMSPMSISLMQGAQAAPQAAQPNNLQAFMGNPLTSIGMGLLGGNYGTNSREAFANAMRGGLLGMQQARVGQIQQEQLAAQRAELKRQQDEETQMRQWAQSKGLDPNMPEWALKAQYEQEMKSKYPSAAQFGTSAHMFVNQQNPKDVIIGQMSTSGGAYTFDSQGKPIPIDPTKYMYHKPLSIQNFGDRVGAINTLTAQGMPIGSGYPSQGVPMQREPIPQPNMSPRMPPPVGTTKTEINGVPATFVNNGNANPADWQMAMDSVEQSTRQPQAIPGSGMVGGDPTTGRIGTSPDQSPQLKAEQETAKLEAQSAFEKKKMEPKVRRLGYAIQTKNAMLERSFDQALKNTSGWTTGFLGKIGSFAYGSPAYDLQESLKPIIANLGFDKLQEMRDNSPTGGALGQVSERELDLLISAVASLDTAQSEQQFRENLQLVKEHYNNYLNAYARAYEEDYGRPLFPGQKAKVSNQSNSELEALRKEFGITK